MEFIDICSLGSGSRGNSFALGAGGKVLLIDAGFSRREILCRMEKCGLAPDKLIGVLLTHEHQDHVKGCRVLCDNCGIPLYCSGRTAEYLRRKKELPEHTVFFEPGDRFQVGAFEIAPFSVQHDAIDPVGFVIDCGGLRIGIATDLGELNTLGKHRLSGCDALVLESNYDKDMLYNSDRQLYLKRRINGRNGHLGNRDCAAVLPELLSSATKLLMLVHVSSECNTYDLVDEIGRGVLRRMGLDKTDFAVVHQDVPSEIFHLGGE